MADFAAVRKLASLPTRTVSLCLAGELVEKIEQLKHQLAEAKAPTSIGEASPKRAIAEQIVAVQEEMRESTVDFKLKAMPARAWSVLFASKPTQGEKESDEDWEPRIFPFYASLVSRVVVEPAMTEGEVGELADLLHVSAWNDILRACMSINTGEVDIPNFVAASELTETSEQM